MIELSSLLLLSLHLVRLISLQSHNMQFGRRSLFSTIFKRYNRKLTGAAGVACIVLGNLASVGTSRTCISSVQHKVAVKVKSLK